MRKAELKQHILTKHGEEQLKALGVKQLPDHLNSLNSLNSDLNREFGHNTKPSLRWKLRRLLRKKEA